MKIRKGGASETPRLQMEPQKGSITQNKSEDRMEMKMRKLDF